ncbi:MAG: substrate-binding domain-containing protein [Gemmatimonadales bacterium]
MGTTYTVEQSGALALLDSLATPTPVAVVVGPSGQILSAAARGDFDVVLTHAPSLEHRLLVAAGLVRRVCPFATSRFAVVGPPGDPAGVAQAQRAAEAFGRIARARATFVSRGDSSGTHVKELELWRTAGITPDRPWYVESGADQTTTLHVADERGNAYALADLPTFARLPGLRLQVLFTADTVLVNRYTLYVMRSGPGAAHPAGDAFGSWALATWRPRVLALRLPAPNDGPAFEAGADTECASATAPP